MSNSNSWNIRPRSNQCSVTNKEFEDGEMFYTAIFLNQENNFYERSDFSVSAWDKTEHTQEDSSLFSFW
ncbi:MAG: hypothetical protein CMO46_12620, partial [Verrucomicrobiales bacterium]|nr:hypothetical protein [Verrucomicrobiales bacterium]